MNAPRVQEGASLHTSELMEYWRIASDLPAWMRPFDESTNAARKYLVSSTREPDGWNAEAPRPFGPAQRR